MKQGPTLLAENPRREFLILIATTTIEKIAQYNAIARLQNQPITFINFREVTDFHSTDEEKGNRLEHALDKSQAIMATAELLKHSPAYRNALQKVCASHNFSYDPQNIIVATEDSSMSLFENDWRRVKPTFAEYLPQDTIDNAEKDVITDHGSRMVYRGPGSEIGPILGAMRIAGFMEAATKGAALGQDSPSLDISTLVVWPLTAAPTDEKIALTASQINHLRSPQKNVDYMRGHWLDWSALHMNLPQSPEQSLSDDWEGYLKNHSPRSKIVRDLASFLSTLPHTKPDLHLTSAGLALTNNKTPSIRIMSGNVSEQKMPRHLKKQGIADNRGMDPTSFLNPLDLSANFKQDSDAFYFAPPRNNLQSLVRAGYVFFSTLVEKQIEAESANKPIIVVDDGNMSSLMETYVYMVNAGMAKDYDRVAAYEASDIIKNPVLDTSIGNVECAEHKGFGMLDLVRYADPSCSAYPVRLQNAAVQVLLRRCREYTPYVGKKPHVTSGPSVGNEPYRKDIMKVAVFTSAGNDNLRLIEDNAAIARSIADKNAGLVWGAMDRHSGGAVYEAYLDAGGPWTEAYSTPSILTQETKRGCMPQCSYSEVSPHIFARMEKLIKASDVIVVTPGGFGTVQEMLAVLVLMHERPDLMKNKNLVIHNQTLWGEVPFWDPVIKNFLGEEALQTLKQKGVLEGNQIYMTATASEVDTLLGLKKDEWEYNREVAATPVRQGASVSFPRYAA